MRAALLPLLIMATACHPPFQDSSGPPDTDADADTDTDADADTDTDGDVDNPPQQLCEDGAAWGYLDTDLSLDQDGTVRGYAPGTQVEVVLPIAGQADLCEIECSAHWIDTFYISDTKEHLTELSLPIRVAKGVTYYYYIDIEVPGEIDDIDEHCFLESSAGKHWIQFEIRN
jgi:hypothetical protein